MRINRRKFLQKSLQGGSALLANSLLPAHLFAAKQDFLNSVIVFSRQLEWITDYRELAETVAEIGFNGLELTTRPGGHVTPEKVEEDLPRMAEAAQKADIRITMIATRITDPEDPAAVPTLRTASALKIPFYRMGGLSYNSSADIEATLENFKSIFTDLSQLNREYKIHGAYQSHAGSNRISAASWDLWYLLKDLDPEWIGCEYDTRHTQLENGSWWPNGLRLLRRYIKSMVIKDFKLIAADGKRRARNCPLGEGEVDFSAFFSLVKDLNISGPLILHFPWLNSLELDKLNHSQRRKKTIQIMKEKGINKLKHFLEEAELT